MSARALTNLSVWAVGIAYGSKEKSERPPPAITYGVIALGATMQMGAILRTAKASDPPLFFALAVGTSIFTTGVMFCSGHLLGKVMNK